MIPNWPGGQRVPPLYKLYRYLLPQGVWLFGLKMGMDFDCFGLKV